MTGLPAIPAEWVAAAMKGGALTDPFLSDRVKVKILLEGAAPLIAAAERQRMSLTYGKTELDELATQLCAVEDWLRDKCEARHHEDMADVIGKAHQVIDDLYDEVPG